MSVMLRRRIADLTGTYEPGRKKQNASLRDPMAAARKRRQAEEKQRIADEKAAAKAAELARDLPEPNRNGDVPPNSPTAVSPATAAARWASYPSRRSSAAPVCRHVGSPRG